MFDYSTFRHDSLLFSTTVCSLPFYYTCNLRSDLFEFRFDFALNVVYLAGTVSLEMLVGFCNVLDVAMFHASSLATERAFCN